MFVDILAPVACFNHNTEPAQGCNAALAVAVFNGCWSILELILLMVFIFEYRSHRVGHEEEGGWERWIRSIQVYVTYTLRH